MPDGLSRAPRRSRITTLLLAMAAAVMAIPVSPTLHVQALSTDTNQAMMSGTSPSIAALAPGGWAVAYQGSSGHLLTYSSGVATDTGQVMMSGTSPSIAALAGDGWEVAYQGSSGHLFTYSSSGVVTDTGQVMMSGTSPSIAALPGSGLEVAFQATTTALCTYSPSGGTTNTGLGMMSGTSPSIAVLPTGAWEVAFEANTTALWTYSSSTGGGTNDNLGMMSGTSPSIAVLPTGAWEIAFEANTSVLWTYSSSTGGGTNTNQGMSSGTSPSIAALPDGTWQIAFQANTATLYNYSSTGVSTNTSQGMLSGTGPSIAASLAGTWQIASQANTGHLYTYTPPPSVSSVSPQVGASAGGTTVTINGNNFDSTTTVNFGSQAAAMVSLTSTQLTVITPAENAGQVPVTVMTTAGGTSTAGTPATTFQFSKPGPFRPLTTRICDTNSGNTTPCTGHTIAAGASLPVQVTGIGNIPNSGVAAVAMDLFTAPTVSGSYGNIAVFPTGLAGASDLSWVNGSYGTLLIEIPVGLNGQVTLVNNSPNSALNVILDVQGYIADTQTDASGLINPISQAPSSVICNTGDSTKQCYIPQNAGLAPGAPNAKTFTVLGQGGVPLNGVSAVALNVQTYAENNAGWLVVYPTGQPQPGTASMLWNAWTPLTNHIIVPVNPATGQFTVYNGGPGTTQLSIGVDAWFTDNSNPSATGGLYYGNNGTLICDTMTGTGTPCSTGQKLDAARVVGPDPLAVQVTGQGGIPSGNAGITGVELQLTVTNESGVGNGTYLCVYASNSSCQEADLNLYGGVPANLLVIVPVGPDGQVDIYTPTGSMDILVSVSGYYVDPTIVNAPNLPVSPATFNLNPSAYPQLDVQGSGYTSQAVQEHSTSAPVDASAPEFTASTVQGTANPSLAPPATKSYYILQRNLLDSSHQVEQNLGMIQPTGVRTSVTLSFGSPLDSQHFKPFACDVSPCSSSSNTAMLSAEQFLDGYVQNQSHLQQVSFVLAVGLNNSGNAPDPNVQYANGQNWFNQITTVLIPYARYLNQTLANKGVPLRLYIWAGDDLEDSFNIPAAASLQWLKGIQDQDVAVAGGDYVKVLNFGGFFSSCAASSCWDQAYAASKNNFGWTQHLNWEAMWGGPTGQLQSSPVWPAPEIYDAGWPSAYYNSLDSAAAATGVGVPNYPEVTWHCNVNEPSAGSAWADFVNGTGHHPGSVTYFHSPGSEGTGLCN